MANLQVYHRGGGFHGGTGYPMVRLLALVACGTRTVIDAAFGAGSVGETTYTLDLLRGMRRGMIVPADCNFVSQALLAAVRDTGAHLLVRIKNSRNLPVCARLPWIETALLELKSTILGGRVLRTRPRAESSRRSTRCSSPTRRCASRSPTPPWCPDVDPDGASFTIAPTGLGTNSLTPRASSRTLSSTSWALSANASSTT
ncbi:transposase [Rhodococcus opacus]|uniref:transposase n=1 Tax=Rhodococcus opacus TaxID=37919 RepID=UPI0024732551|nr:transposase [Rhodococcus opacus]